MSDKGWIKLDRNIQDNWLWTDYEFSYGQAWVDLIMLADIKDKKKPFRGELVQFKRGTVHLSITALSERWRWSRGKTKRFLKLLEKDKMIVINATTHRTTITLVNYGFFQDSRSTNSTTNDTTSGQQADSKRTTPKEVKNKKNERIYMAPPAEEIDEEVPERFRGKTEEEIMAMIEAEGFDD